MKSPILDSSYNVNLYNSSVNAPTELSKNFSQRRPSYQSSNKTNTNSYLTTDYPNNRKKQDQFLRITISTTQKMTENGGKRKMDPFLRSSLNETSTQSKSASKNQRSPLVGFLQGMKTRERGNSFRQPQQNKKYDQRIKNVNESSDNVSNLLQKINHNNKIIKQIQKICQNRVSDNIRKVSQGQKGKLDESYSGKNNKYGGGIKNLKVCSLDYANQDIGALQVPVVLNKDLTKSTDYGKYNTDVSYNYLNLNDSWKKADKKQLQLPTKVVKNKNPEEQFLSKEGFSKINSSYLTPRQQKNYKEPNSYNLQDFKMEKKQKINPYTAKSDLLNIPQFQSHQKIEQIPEKNKRAGSSYRSYSNLQDNQIRIEPASATVKRSTQYEDNLKERKNIKDMRQMAETKSIKNNSNYFSQTKVGINDFQLKKSLGQGKFGLVFQAFHIQTKSLYAIKKISKKVIKSNLMVDQLLQEIKIQSYCNHQNILKIYGFFDDSEFIYLILQYMEQGTLFSQLKKQKTLSQHQAAIQLKHIAAAIAYLHQNGIAHRDIKPENIVMSNGLGKLCDFGWAAICTDRRKTYCGTFDYVAPEILEGSDYDISVDLWCLGVLAYQLMVGKAPFYHISRKQTMKKIMNVEKTAIEFPAHLSKNAVSFIESLVKKNPQQRLNGQNILKHPFLAAIKEVSE